MKNLRLISVTAACLFTSFLYAQDMTIEEYINKYKGLAMEEMQRTGVPAAIGLAQGIVETENGNSVLVKKSNNHFGIKCKEDWRGPTVSHDDDSDGECFRKYPNAEASWRDHSDFLRTRKYYTSLFELDPTDYKAWAYGLKKAGYATNPKYADLLIKYIEQYNLNQYSLIAMGRIKQSDEVFATAETKKVEVSTDVVVAEKSMQPDSKTSVNAINADLSKLENVQVVESEKEQAKPALYPQGEFKINATRVVFANKGTPFLAIAQQYEVQLKWLFDFNEIKETEVVPEDQLVYIQRKRTVGAEPTYKVAAGETLYEIAQKEGIRLDYLLRYNQLSVKEQPVEGEILYLQGPAPSKPKVVLAGESIYNLAFESFQTDEPVNHIAVKSHIVQPKETLYGIARSYGVSVTSLRQLNNLEGYDVKIGQELIISK